MVKYFNLLLILSIIIVYSISCSVEEKEKTEIEISSIYQQFALADSLMAQAKFDSSNVVLRNLSQECLKESSYVEHLKALNKVAGNYDEMGKNDSMRIVLDYILDFAEDHLDSVNLNSAQANYAYGIFFLNQSIFDSAKIFLNRALEQRKKLLHANSPEIGDVYNVLGNIEFYFHNNQKALFYYKSALNLMLNRGFYTKGVGLVYMNIGLVYDNLYQFEKARAYLDTSYQIQKDILDANHPILAQININKMSIFANSGELDSAIISGIKAMKIISSKFGANHPYNGMIYNNLGMCYSSYGDDENALIYFEKAKNILESIKSNFNNQLTKCYALLGNLNLNRKNYMQATKYFENALELMKSENSNNVYESSQYKKLLAVSYAKLGKKKEAIQKINEAVNDWGKSKKTDQMELAKTEVFLAQVLNIVGDYDKSIKIAKKYIIYFEKTTNTNYLFFSYSQLAKAYLNKKDYQKVLKIYQKLFEYFPTTNADYLIDVKKVISYFELEGHIISLLSSSEKAANLLYNHSKDSKYLDVSQDISEILSEIFFDNYEKIITQTSKFTESKKYKDEINLAINLAYKKFTILPNKENFEHTLKLAEFNKSISLLESLNEKSAFSKLSIPKKELVKLQKLKSSINFYQRNLSSDEAELADSIEIGYYRNRLFDLRNEYRNYKSELSKKHPQLNSLLKINLNASVDFIRDSLIDKNQTAIEYYLHYNQMYIFGISNEEYFIEHIALDENIKSRITSLLKSIIENEKEIFEQFSYNIYNEIFSKIDSKIKTERLIIIPDGELAYIPFDALLFELPELKSDYRDLPYLLKKYSIGYAYSFNILEKIKGGEKIVTDFIGLAPFNSIPQQSK